MATGPKIEDVQQRFSTCDGLIQAFYEVTGRTDVEFVHAHGAPHRPIDATHHSSLNGELYLTYADAAFNGTVEIAAKSFSATNLHNALGREEGLPWYGSREGADRMRVKTQGWAGLYF